MVRCSAALLSVLASIGSTLSGEPGVYNPIMAITLKRRPKGSWTPEEIARNERVAQARVARDRKRGVSANLEEGVALTRFANRFAEAFRDARRT
jgi:hypothetical protein